MAHVTRRVFTRTAAATTAALAIPGWAIADRRLPRSANDTMRIAVAGLNGRGRNHLVGFQRLDGVEVVALCDPDSKVLSEASRQYGQKYQRSFECQKDIRTLLERDDIDAVSIATPNHWHALMTIWSCQAGKDVYVEKPVCHNVKEGLAMVDVARRTGRIVQTGTQGRSSTAIRDAFKYVQGGNLGRPRVARGLCYKPRQSIGLVNGPQPVPDHIDYDLWVGPAAMEPLQRRRLHYDWHWDFNTGNGDLGNQGVHQMDICRWAIGADTLSPSVISIGGRFGYEDNGNTPNTQVIYHDYPEVPIIFEVRGLPRDRAARNEGWGGNMDRMHGNSICACLECEDGVIVTNNDYNRATVLDSDGEVVTTFTGSRNHFEDFVQACRSRRHEDLSADINEGALSSNLCHTGNISHHLGRPGTASEALEAVSSREGATDAVTRMITHLRANQVDVDRPSITIGPWLEMDVEDVRFTNRSEADKLLAGNVRGEYSYTP